MNEKYGLINYTKHYGERMVTEFILPLISFAAFIALIFLSVRISSSTTRTPGSNVYLFFCIAAAFIAFIEFQVFISDTPRTAQFWMFFASLWPFAAALFHHFILTFLNYKLSRYKSYLFFLYGAALFMAVSFFMYVSTGEGLVIKDYGIFMISPYGDNLLSGGAAVYGGYFFSIANIFLIVYWFFLKAQRDQGLKRFLAFAFLGSYAAVGLVIIGIFLSGRTMPEFISLQYLLFAVFSFAAIRRYNFFNLNPNIAVENIISAMQDLFFLCNSDGTVVKVNQKTEDVMAVPKTDLEGKYIGDILLNGYKKIPDETKFCLKVEREGSGERSIVEFAFSSISNKRGRNIGYICLGYDLTGMVEREQELRKSLEEKTVLLREIHHRVKNNLQVIISLLELRAGILDTGNSKEMLKEEISRIRVISMVHNLLYKENDLRIIYLPNFVMDIIHLAAETFDKPSIGVIHDIHIPPMHLNMDRSIILGLILYEAVNNAYKHDFVPSGKGNLVVDGIWENEELTLMVVNNNSQECEISADCKTLGLQLMEVLSDQIEGTIVISSCKVGKEGWRVMLTIPAGET
jgi:two-component sensor histidine kinase